MSGGELDYLYAKLEMNESKIKVFLKKNVDEKTARKIMEIVKEIIEFLYALEWWMSGDYDYNNFLWKVEKLRLWKV